MYSLNDHKTIETLSLSEIRHDLRQMIHFDEEKCVDNLLLTTQMTIGERNRLVDAARVYVDKSRAKSDSQGTMDYFLQEFGPFQ